MKKLMFAFLAMLGSAVIVNAQDATTQDNAEPSSEVVAAEQDQPAQDEDSRVQLKAEELPDAIKQTLEDQEYKGWLINTAYHDKKEERYEVELKNGADTQVIKFNDEGQRIDE